MTDGEDEEDKPTRAQLEAAFPGRTFMDGGVSENQLAAAYPEMADAEGDGVSIPEDELLILPEETADGTGPPPDTQLTRQVKKTGYACVQLDQPRSLPDQYAERRRLRRLVGRPFLGEAVEPTQIEFEHRTP